MKEGVEGEIIIQPQPSLRICGLATDMLNCSSAWPARKAGQRSNHLVARRVGTGLAPEMFTYSALPARNAGQRSNHLSLLRKTGPDGGVN